MRLVELKRAAVAFLDQLAIEGVGFAELAAPVFLVVAVGAIAMAAGENRVILITPFSFPDIAWQLKAFLPPSGRARMDRSICRYGTRSAAR